jgi:hypothetical protein
MTTIVAVSKESKVVSAVFALLTHLQASVVPTNVLVELTASNGPIFTLTVSSAGHSRALTATEISENVFIMEFAVAGVTKTYYVHVARVTDAVHHFATIIADNTALGTVRVNFASRVDNIFRVL